MSRAGHKKAPMLFFLDIRLQSHRPLSFCELHDSSITFFFSSSGGLELDRFRCRIACHRVTFPSCQLGVGSRQYVIAVLEDAPTWSGCCFVVTFAVPRSPALMNEGTYPLFSVRSAQSRRGPACEVTTPAPHKWKTLRGSGAPEELEASPCRTQTAGRTWKAVSKDLLTKGQPCPRLGGCVWYRITRRARPLPRCCSPDKE